MNDADKKAFEAHWKKSTCAGYNEKLSAKAAWQAACEWRDSQSPTAQINQQLVEALQALLAAVQKCHCENSGAAQEMAHSALQAARGE